MSKRTGANAGHQLRREDVSAQDERRFWRMVEMTDGCWYWRGAELGEYGTFQLRAARRHERAHKVSAALAYGEVPKGAVVMHSCDEPSCVRPAHLSVGTQKENVLDCIKKQRHRKQRAA
ncbi:HNH endonuclease signature motif containing protein [Humibacter sp.]|uniref:HNH endonuclease signature motif containing protein n=1 Tax=Humibacter sp. TaxID=1940291 RepID=UPI003F7F2840